MRSAFTLAGVGLHGRRRVGLLATFLVLVLAAIGMACGLVVSSQGPPLLDAAAAEAEVAHLVVYGDAEAVARVAADDEVVASEGPFPTVTDAELLVAGEEVPFELTALDSPDITVNRPLLQAGRWVGSSEEIVLDRSVATDLGIDLGDDLRVRYSGAIRTYQVVGTGVSLTDCLYPQCEPARSWVTSGGLTRLDDTDNGDTDNGDTDNGDTDSTNTIGGDTENTDHDDTDDGVLTQGWLRFEDPAQADPFVERQAAAGVTGITGTNSWLDTREDFLTLDRVFGAFVSAFGTFVLVVAAVVVAGSMALRVVSRRREIGLLGAIGCTPRQITSGLLVENIGLGVAAGVLGWALAGFLAPSLQLGIGRTLGPQDPTWSGRALMITVAAIVTILLLATVVPSLSAARRPVTDVLRDVPSSQVSAISRRVSGLPTRLSLLGVHDVASQPTRSALAALAVVVAVVGTVVSLGFIGAVDAVADDPAMAGDPWDVAVVRGEQAPADVEAVLADTKGVASWFSDSERRSTVAETAVLTVATGGPAEDAGEGIAGYGFLERFGLAVGDTVDVLAGTAPITVEIVGSYRETEDSGRVLRYRVEALEAVEGDIEPDVYRIRAGEGTAPDELAGTLSAALGPDTRVVVLDTGVADLGPLLMVLRLVALVLLAVAATNLLSTLLTTNQESAGRIGVQVAIGFTPRQVVEQGAVSGAALGVVAALVGLPLGWWLFRWLSDLVSTDLGVGPGWMPAPPALELVALGAVAIIVSAGLGALAVVRTVRRPVSDLVRHE
jgi:putative ABC transport system permease protein